VEATEPPVTAQQQVTVTCSVDVPLQATHDPHNCSARSIDRQWPDLSGPHQLDRKEYWVRWRREVLDRSSGQYWNILFFPPTGNPPPRPREYQAINYALLAPKLDKSWEIPSLPWLIFLPSKFYMVYKQHFATFSPLKAAQTLHGTECASRFNWLIPEISLYTLIHGTLSTSVPCIASCAYELLLSAIRGSGLSQRYAFSFSPKCHARLNKKSRCSTYVIVATYAWGERMWSMLKKKRERK
jgi:hypothetical protein